MSVALISLLFIGPTLAQTLSEAQKLLASDGEALDSFGWNVAVDGDTAVIGATGDDDNGNGAGAAYIFSRTAGVWTEQQKLIASDGAANNAFGIPVAIDGDTAVVAAWQDDNGGGDIGSAYVFRRAAGI